MTALVSRNASITEMIRSLISATLLSARNIFPSSSSENHSGAAKAPRKVIASFWHDEQELFGRCPERQPEHSGGILGRMQASLTAEFQPNMVMSEVGDFSLRNIKEISRFLAWTSARYAQVLSLWLVVKQAQVSTSVELKDATTPANSLPMVFRLSIHCCCSRWSGSAMRYQGQRIPDYARRYARDRLNLKTPPHRAYSIAHTD